MSRAGGTGVGPSPPIFNIPKVDTGLYDQAVEFEPNAYLRQRNCTILDSTKLSVSMWVWIDNNQFGSGDDITIMSFGDRPKSVRFSPGGASQANFDDQPLKEFGPSKLYIRARDNRVIAKFFDTTGTVYQPGDFLSPVQVWSREGSVKLETEFGANGGSEFIPGMWNWITVAANGPDLDLPLAIQNTEFAFPCQLDDLAYNGGVIGGDIATIRYAQVMVWTSQAIDFKLAGGAEQTGFAMPPYLRYTPDPSLGLPQFIIDDDQTRNIRSAAAVPPGVSLYGRYRPPRAVFYWGLPDILFYGDSTTASGGRQLPFWENQGLAGPFEHLEGAIVSYRPAP